MKLNRDFRYHTGRIFVRAVNNIVDDAVLLLLLLLLAIGCYAVWDSYALHQQAQASSYEVYKPSPEDKRSFEDFQKLNPDVFGWLNIYGTNIDYPMVQAEDNEKYLNTSADGKYSLSGSIFLNYRNQTDFSDFNSIVYGHHMKDKVMFGEIGLFKEKKYFQKHPYGSIYFQGKNHGIEFFAFLEVDAYNQEIYRLIKAGRKEKTKYLNLLVQSVMYTRKIHVDANDHVVLFSTCTEDITNGRHILVGKITDTPHKNPFSGGNGFGKTVESILQNQQSQKKVIILGCIFFLAATVIGILRKRKRKQEEKEG